MPTDSIIFKSYQGDEADLLERLNTFLNITPKKRVLHIDSWTIGITTYVLVIFTTDEEPKAEVVPELTVNA